MDKRTHQYDPAKDTMFALEYESLSDALKKPLTRSKTQKLAKIEKTVEKKHRELIKNIMGSVIPHPPSQGESSKNIVEWYDQRLFIYPRFISQLK